MSENPSIIQTFDLSKRFGDIEALKSLDLSVPEHSITGFLGPNGAGKSTTIKLLLGLLKPSSGMGTIFGLDIERNSPEIRRRVGYLSQNPHFYPEMSAREILRFTAKFFYTGTQKAITNRVEEMLEMVGLGDKGDRPVKGFSGGERQRLGIAQAQVNYPDLLILDEPAAALDPMGRQDVLKIMEQLREKTTVFYSTHILDDVQKVSDRVVILNQGKLIAQGPIDALLRSGREVVYSIKFEGNPNYALKKVRTLSWVENIEQEIRNGMVNWRVSVTDAEIARKNLLPYMVAMKDVTILAFAQKEQELEEVFMKVVAGGNNGTAV
ncbi:ABC transporter ATP-binding protein [bacterium]|nr:ABC transporter ATP-binding protein [bacterium]